MKIALLLRGFHFLDQDRFGYPLDARPLLPSLLEQVLAPLRREHAVKVFAITYPSPIEPEVRAVLNPDRLFLLDPKASNQLATFRRGLQEVLADSDAPFDRVIVTRFDLVYLQSILNWNIWDRSGVFFPWREYEEYWQAHHRVGDVFHVVDGPWIADFEDAIGRLGPQADLHRLYDVLAARQTPLHFAEQGFYDSNTLFDDPECANPIYRIGNRPQLTKSRSATTTLLRTVRRAIPNRLWKLLTHPRLRRAG